MKRTTVSGTTLVTITTLLVLSLLVTLTHGVDAAVGARPGGTHQAKGGVLKPALRKVDSILARMAKQKAFSGAVLVARGGSVLFTKGYGMADRQHHVLNTVLTQFRIGTSTNQFTAMAILQLQAEGKLHVQDHVCAYVVPCPKAWRPITLHELLTHTSGMADFPAQGDPSTSMTPARLLAAAKATPLNSRPGSMWSYSNLGYVVLGYVIEKVSHRSYGSFLQTHIFTPAKMSDSGYNDTLTKPKRLAVGYNDAYTAAAYVDMSNAYSSAGVYSTVGDLYRWDQALSTARVASPKTVSRMFTSYWTLCRTRCPVPPDPPEWGYKTQVWQAGYGYGWGTARLQHSHHRLFVAAGGFEGDLPYNGRYPDDKADIIVLTNQDDVDIAAIVRLLEHAVLQER
jgi:CubicO group peptidase (beta-lactamase class C family)